jgi:uncharacterized protein (DUF697 family)
MRLTEYEKQAQREIEQWHQGGADIPGWDRGLSELPRNLTGLARHAADLVMKPVDWAVERVVPPALIDRLSDAIGEGLGYLNDASTWTFEEDDVLVKARQRGIQVDRVSDLRDRPLEELDPLARDFFNQNAILAAVEGGGTSLGGPLFIAADIPLLFTINFRVIQQIGGTYGFPLRQPEFRPLVVAIYNVAASGSRDAKHAALRELSVAAAAFAHETGYRGRRAQGTFREQNRHVPRELAKNLAARKLGQLIPIAGAAVGAGVNYWFTEQTAKTAYMLFRSLYLERKERL